MTMSDSRSFSQSFSNGSFSAPSVRAPKKRKVSQEQHGQRRRRKVQNFERTDAEMEVDDHLCDSCRTIDFEAVLDIEPDETVTIHGFNVCDLGEIAPYSKAATCKLCSMFALILSYNQLYEPPRQGHWYLRAFTTATLRNRSHTEASRAQDMSIVIALSSKPDELNKDDIIACIDRGVIMPWRDARERDLDGFSASHIITCSRGIDFGRLKEMLFDCDANHVKCKERIGDITPFPVKSRVIDGNTREVVSLQPGCTYLALSYVWGLRKVEELQNPQSFELPEVLPSTIEDAISVTKALGVQYLWVDRYCVDQSQNDDTQHQLAQMGSIYSHAYVTICALGDHDNVGLPGVSFNRKRQLRTPTQDAVLSWTGPSMRRTLKFSKWRDRGWTYQESVLSRRSLFFTGHYVALNCDSETARENIRSNYFHTWSFNKESELFGDVASRSRVIYPAQAFDRHLQEFQRRQLSYVSDTLNAFKGILAELSVRSYWGVPLYKVVLNKRIELPELQSRELETGFVAGLCWKVRSSSHSAAPDRDNFPSWSWVGQKYARVFDNRLARSYQLEVAQIHFSAFQPSIRVIDIENNSVTLQELSEAHVSSKIIPEQTKFIEIRSVLVHWTRRRKTQKDTNWVDNGLDAYQVGENGWWKSDYIGDLHLDPSYDELVKPHDKCNKHGPICEHLSLKSGAAVLLSLHINDTGSHIAAHAIWMVVKLVKGGTYRRMGIIVSNQSVKSRAPIASPSEDMLETIKLG